MQKIKYTCGIPTQATCVTTEVTPNEQSSLTEETCLDQEQVNEDVYEQLGDIWSEVDLTALGELCLDYTLESGKIIVKNVLLKYEEKICELQSRIVELEERELCSFPISGCEFELGELVDECGEQPQTLKDLLQILINQHITP